MRLKQETYGDVGSGDEIDIASQKDNNVENLSFETDASCRTRFDNLLDKNEDRCQMREIANKAKEVHDELLPKTSSFVLLLGKTIGERR